MEFHMAQLQQYLLFSQLIISDYILDFSDVTTITFKRIYPIYRLLSKLHFLIPILIQTF